MTTHRRMQILLASFLVAVPVVLILGYQATTYRDRLPPWLRSLTDGFGGNIVAGIIGSFLFLLLTFYLDARAGEQIERIVAATAASESILAKRERILQNREEMERFEQFLQKESYHDVRFPKLKGTSSPLGLEYTIEPVRDPKTRRPLKHEAENDVKYVIKVRGPAHWEFMKQEKQKDYENSPIRDGEYYFCQYFSDSWHMAADSIMADAHSFYLSGKVGPCEWGTSANSFVATFENPLRSLKEVACLLLSEDGTIMSGEGGCTQCRIFRDDDGSLFLSVDDSPPKKMYLTNPPETHNDSEWFLRIEDMGGRAPGQKLANVRKAVLEKLTKLQIEPRKIPWNETDDYVNERP